MLFPLLLFTLYLSICFFIPSDYDTLKITTKILVKNSFLSVQFFSFSDLFHEGLHDGTASNAQNHELVRSRPVAMLKLNIIVTLNMLETNFATLHTKNTIVIKIEKWQIVLIEGLSRVAVRRIDHQQLLIEVVISKPHSN